MKTVDLAHKEVMFIKKYFPMLVKGFNEDIAKLKPTAQVDLASLDALYSLQEYRDIVKSILAKVTKK